MKFLVIKIPRVNPKLEYTFGTSALQGFGEAAFRKRTLGNVTKHLRLSTTLKGRTADTFVRLKAPLREPIYEHTMLTA